MLLNKKQIINYNNPRDADNDTLIYNLTTDIVNMTDCDNILTAYGKLEVPKLIWSCEAEHANLTGSAEIRTNCDNASGGDFVKLGNTNGNSIQFNNINILQHGTYLLNINYFSVNNLTVELLLNGTSLGAHTFPAAQWCYQAPPKTFSIDVELNKGINTFEISVDNSSSSPLFDRLDIYENIEPRVNQPLKFYIENTAPNIGAYAADSEQTSLNKIITNEKLWIFPNPTSSVVNIRFVQNRTAEVLIKLTDISGRIIKTKRYETVEGNNILKLQIPKSIAKGIYFLDIESDNKRTVKKMILR